MQDFGHRNPPISSRKSDKRMKMIIKEIKRLSNFTMEEMNEWYKQLKPIVEHNNKQLYELDSLNELIKIFKDITDK